MITSRSPAGARGRRPSLRTARRQLANATMEFAYSPRVRVGASSGIHGRFGLPGEQCEEQMEAAGDPHPTPR